jgi:NAD(P)-dependent dehydrogenase (short-subunit alcohol dehydrogenase family)
VSGRVAGKVAFAATQERFGGFHILVNNAGVASPPPDGFEAITFDGWRKVMSVNLDGVFLGMRQAVLAMKDAGGGGIVNIGSVAA